MLELDQHLASLMAKWQDQLALQRRFSPYTCSAYQHDLLAFLKFLTHYRGERISLSVLKKICSYLNTSLDKIIDFNFEKKMKKVS